MTEISFSLGNCTSWVGKKFQAVVEENR